jgi:signal transduction histidine kinase
MSTSQRPSASSLRKFAAPFGLVAIALVLTLGLGLMWAASRADALALATQTSQLRMAIAVEMDRMRGHVGSELQWDDAVAALANDFDPTWADSHLADWFHTTKGIEHVVVFDAENRAMYFSTDGERAETGGWAQLGIDTDDLLAPIRKRELDRGDQWQPAADFSATLSRPIDTADFKQLHGRAAVVTATLVQPDFGRSLPRGPRSAIVVTTKWVDQPFLDRVGEVLRVQDLRIARMAPARSGRAGMPITDTRGRAVAGASWQPERPGHALLLDALPFLLAVSCGLIMLIAVAVLRTWDFHRQVQAGEATAVRQAALLERMSALGEIGAWELDPTSNTLRYSRYAYQMAGLDPDSPITPESSAALYCGDSFDRLNHALHIAITEAKPFEVMLEMRSSQGRVRTVRMQGSPVMDGKRCVLVSGTAKDITEQVQREQALKRQTDLLERMSRIADVGAWEYVVKTRTLNFTDHVHRMYGFAPDVQLSLEKVAALYSEQDRMAIFDVMARAIKEGAPWDLEMNPTTADGRSVWVRGVGETEWADGKPVRLIGTLRDVTRERAAAAALARAMDDLRTRNSDLQEFTYAASHDLQEPVRKVQALGSLLIDRFGEVMPDGALDYIARMRAAASRMGTLIDDVLSYSKVSVRPGQATAVSLTQIAREVVDDLATLVDRSGGVVHIGELPQIEADPTQMRQLLQNLIGNALKYRHPDRVPEVWVEGEVQAADAGQASWCRIVVRDNGIGFDNRFAETIFAPFRRLHDRSVYDGTGMGLAIVRRIAEWHHGRVDAIGAQGEGSRFVVELPVRRGESFGERGASQA